MAMSDRLKKEMETFEQNRERLMAESLGKFVLIRGDEIDGVWDTYQDALAAGYKKYGLDPFLVKRILGTESLQFFTRDVVVCP
jgi:hypothetical protein